MLRRIEKSPGLTPLALLAALAFVFWARVLVTGQVLLPGAMLRGFLPFGGDAQAPWVILQWDSLAQYFPWRHYAAQQLRGGQIPLWNPYEFTGAPLLVNAQSAVFYPFNLPFWVMDTAYAFGVTAFLHTLLALCGTYLLARRWRLSRAAAVVSAGGFAFCGYLSAWALLPTLAATAAWLPLCLLLLERAVEEEKPLRPFLWLCLCLTCALLAGHAQIFFYLVLALCLRVPFLKYRLTAMALLVWSLGLCALLGALQLLPTAELAKYGHRAGGPPTGSDWEFWLPRALHLADLPSLLIPAWPLPVGTLNENFGYVGTGVILLALLGVTALFSRRAEESAADRRRWNGAYALTLAVFGLLYAMATPVAKLIFFSVPFVSKMGGPGRALLLWSLGAALLAGFGVDFLRSRVKSPVVPVLALLWIGLELFGNAWTIQPTAPRESIYPRTQLTDWLSARSGPRERVLFLTPQGSWLPTEDLQRFGRTHPPGVLPPNGAMVYGIHEVNGYDSLSPRQYRAWIGPDESNRPSPLLNGNMVLLNNLQATDLLDSLSVGYVVVPQGMPLRSEVGQLVLTADGCDVWQRPLSESGPRVDGRAFFPGWKAGVYAPTTFQLGGFLTLFTLSGLTAVFAAHWLGGRRQAAPDA